MRSKYGEVYGSNYAFPHKFSVANLIVVCHVRDHKDSGNNECCDHIFAMHHLVFVPYVIIGQADQGCSN